MDCCGNETRGFPFCAICAGCMGGTWQSISCRSAVHVQKRWKPSQIGQRSNCNRPLLGCHRWNARRERVSLDIPVLIHLPTHPDRYNVTGSKPSVGRRMRKALTPRSIPLPGGLSAPPPSHSSSRPGERRFSFLCARGTSEVRYGRWYTVAWIFCRKRFLGVRYSTKK